VKVQSKKVSPAFSKAAGCMGQSPCRIPKAAPLVACEASKTILKIPRQGVNSKTVQWTVFEEGTPWERGCPLVAGLKKADCCRKAAKIFYGMLIKIAPIG